MKRIIGLCISFICIFISYSYADVIDSYLGGHGSGFGSDIYSNSALIVLFILIVISVITIILLKKKNK